MHVFKQSYKEGGKSKTTSNWYVEFKSPSGATCRLPAFNDKGQSVELGKKIEKLVNCRVLNETPEAGLVKWVNGLPEKMLSRLVKFGVVEEQRLAGTKGLLVHLEGEYQLDGKPYVIQYDAEGCPLSVPAEAKLVNPGFVQSLAVRNNGSDYQKLVAARVRRLVRGCGFVFHRDITTEKAEQWLADQRKSGKGNEGFTGMSAQTSNWYLQAAKRFTKWMADKGRAQHDPLSGIRAITVKTDRRHDRRAMGAEEVGLLLAAAHGGPTRAGMTGEERWLYYCFSLETGLRPKQTNSLIRASLSLDGENPTVTVQAAYSKNKKVNMLPLRPEMAAMLKEHLKNKLPSAPAFTQVKKGTRMVTFRLDLANARKAWLAAARDPEERAKREGSTFLLFRDAEGKVADFYAQRHTFISNLALAGVHPKVTQTLAQHSTITLTMDRYTHIYGGETTKAIAKLPAFTPPKPADKKQQAAG